MYKIHRLHRLSSEERNVTGNQMDNQDSSSSVVESPIKTTLGAAHSFDQGYESLHSTPKLGGGGGGAGADHRHNGRSSINHQINITDDHMKVKQRLNGDSERSLSKSADELLTSEEVTSGSLGTFDSMVCLLRSGWSSAWRWRRPASPPITSSKADVHKSTNHVDHSSTLDVTLDSIHGAQPFSPHPTPPPPAPEDFKQISNKFADKPIEEEVEERAKWNKKLDFLFSIIGFAVDLANVWRFPYLCYKNGGGVFLIPYSLMLFFGALPLFFLELSIGQFFKSGPISLWAKINPALKGIGYCAVLISWYVSFYYNVIIGWTFYYLYTTITSPDLLPWQHCNNTWNTPNCISIQEIPENCANCVDFENRTSAAEEFYERKLLEIHKSTGFSELGHVKPELVFCMLFTFLLLYVSLFKGVKSSGKVVWVTAIAPYIILTILLIRGLFLKGAITGISYYLEPRYEKLYEPIVWTEAAFQVFFSVGVGFGVHLTYASFNEHKNNCYRDALITAAVNSCTSFYSGFVIFVYLGYIADRMGKTVDKVAKEGYGLVFQVYPEAISTLPYAKFWCVLFFFMLITLGLDSAMGGLEAVITGLMDEFRIKKIRREYFTLLVISSSFLISLVNVTQGGGYTMLWFDTYSAGVSLLCSAFFEAVALVYVYGIDQFCEDVRTMIGFRPAKYWQICWKYVSPFFLLSIIILSIVQSSFEIPKYRDYEFSLSSVLCGWIFSFSSVAAIPLFFAIHTIRKWIQNRNTTNSHSATCHEISVKDHAKGHETVVFV